ncbi:MAG TPA: FAD-dependent monooxygenase, partial [Edaphobacter sp.]|nr:FAD-dependent monooxygenase [Edaphobacter sp.]
MIHPKTNRGSILISGASIAGPSLAYWLSRYGFEVTVVERARSVRSGGYPIDVRGTATEVIERMGMLPHLQAAHIDTRKLNFVDAQGASIAVLPPEALSGGTTGRNIELPRGTLTALLYEKTQNQAIHYRFNDSIAALEDDGAGVSVRFKSGEHGRFDIVVGADGMHSNTRAL